MATGTVSVGRLALEVRAGLPTMLSTIMFSFAHFFQLLPTRTFPLAYFPNLSCLREPYLCSSVPGLYPPSLSNRHPIFALFIDGAVTMHPLTELQYRPPSLQSLSLFHPS